PTRNRLDKISGGASDYRADIAIRSSSSFFAIAALSISPREAFRISSARHSWIGFGDLNEAAVTPTHMFRRAMSSRRDGETSTALGTEIPPNRRRVISSLGADFSRAFTNTWTGFCFARCSMISNAGPASSASSPAAGVSEEGEGGGGSSDGGGGGGGRVSSGGGGVSSSIGSPDGLLLPSLHELVQGDVVHLDHLVPDSGDVPVRPAHPPADALHEDLVVLVDEVDRAVPDRECGDLPAVLHELDLHALSEGRVRLLRLDRDLLEDDPLRLGGTLQGVGLLLELEDPPFVVPVGPAELL